MLVSLCLAATILQGQPAALMPLPSAGIEKPRLMLRKPGDALEPPKIGPRTGWEFPYLVAGYGQNDPQEGLGLRFRVYAQDGRTAEALCTPVARMLMRLWEFNVFSLRIEHAMATGRRVDVYLAQEGKAGGEQFTGVDGTNPANVIYIYDVESFTDPVERAREIAHEYGHATLPPVGGFKEPEEWSNGFLGERLYLVWLREAMRAGELKPDDAAGATPAGLDAYIARQVTPLVSKVQASGPNAALLGKDTKAAMDHYMGVVLAAEQVLPRKVFARSLVLNADLSAKGYLTALNDAIEEGPVEVKVEKGKAQWIPVGKSKITGAATLERKDGWARIQPTTDHVTLTPKSGT